MSWSLRTTALALLISGCAVAPAISAPSAPAGAAVAARAQSLALRTFSSDAGGFDTHSFWVDTGREVVVFDGQFTPALAERLITEIRSQTRSPITTLVITHPNPDKFNGASAFRAIGAKVVASEATARAMPGVHAYKKAYFVQVAKMFTNATYPALPPVDVTFKEAISLPGGIELRLLRHAGVSSTQTVAHVPGARALIVGDLVHHGAHAWLEGGIVDGRPNLDVDAWKAALDELKAYHGVTVYGGRGEPAPLEAAVRDQQAYLAKARALTHDYLVALGERRSELEGPEAGRHHQAIAERLAAAFPGYALPYMASYSIYGLVAAELRRMRVPA